jgi:transglutaminase-like putative cysteine protease
MPRIVPQARIAGLAIVLLGLVAASPARADQESWDAIFVGDTKVGYMHLWVKPVKDGKGRDLLNVRVDYELTFKRGKDSVKMEMFYGTIETPEGEVLRLDTLTKASGQNIRTFGDVTDGKMPLTLEVGGRRSQVVIPWESDVRGPYGSEMSLSREPLKPGESRTVKTYIPDLNKVCLTTLRAVDFEEVPLGPKSEKHKLLRVESSVADADGKAIPGLASTLWVDGSGQIMKSKTDLLGGMYTYRTTEAGAKTESKGMHDILRASIRPTRAIANADQKRDIVYRVTVEGAGDLFPADHRQTSRKESEGSAIVEVKTDGPNAGAPAPAPGPEFLRPNPLINSEHPDVVRRMREAVGRETDPWKKAVAIEDWVAKNVKDKNFSTAFAPAEEVARELSGDCTEHGVLTAAMCRAAGIPARCVVGLVYAPTQGGFGPHMWNEVYVNGRWVAIDAAFGQSQVDATHIKMADTSLDGAAPFESFLPVLRVFQSMKIEPLEIR